MITQPHIGLFLLAAVLGALSMPPAYAADNNIPTYHWRLDVIDRSGVRHFIGARFPSEYWCRHAISDIHKHTFRRYGSLGMAKAGEPPEPTDAADGVCVDESLK